MHSQTPPEVRLKIVAMYQRGELTRDIIAETGSRAIYSVLRFEGLEPSRHRRLRDSDHRRQVMDECIEAMQAAASTFDGGVLRSLDYRDWRTKQLGSPPTADLISRLFNSWEQAVVEAGLQSVRASKTNWVEDDVVGWMQAAATGDNRLSQRLYEQWRSSNDTEAVSATRIHARFGWRQMMAKAQLSEYYPRAYSTHTLLAALAKANSGAYLTRPAYEKWRNTQPPPRPPSAATMVKRFDSWQKATKRARLKRPK